MTNPDKRDVLRLIPYGLYILTTFREENTVNAITCNWLTQVSFQPLKIAVALEKDSYSHLLVQENGVFVINFLGKDQNHLARRMAVPYRINAHKLIGIRYHAGITGAPLLNDAIAFLECEVREACEFEGDHTIFIAEVVAGAIDRNEQPLTLFDSGLRYR